MPPHPYAVHKTLKTHTHTHKKKNPEVSCISTSTPPPIFRRTLRVGHFLVFQICPGCNFLCNHHTLLSELLQTFVCLFPISSFTCNPQILLYLPCSLVPSFVPWYWCCQNSPKTPLQCNLAYQGKHGRLGHETTISSFSK